MLTILLGLLRKQLHSNSRDKVDVNPATSSDHKALSLPSFTVTQTLVNLLAEMGGMLFLSCGYSMVFLLNIYICLVTFVCFRMVAFKRTKIEIMACLK